MPRGDIKIMLVEVGEDPPPVSVHALRIPLPDGRIVFIDLCEPFTAEDCIDLARWFTNAALSKEVTH